MSAALDVAVVTETWAPQSVAALDLLTRPGARYRAAAAAPQSVASLDWGRIHDRLVTALRDAIDRPTIAAANESTYRFLPD